MSASGDIAAVKDERNDGGDENYQIPADDMKEMYDQMREILNGSDSVNTTCSENKNVGEDGSITAPSQRRSNDENCKDDRASITKTQQSADVKAKLIVNYLPQGLSDEEFRAIFQQCGTVKVSKVCRDKKTSQSYGFGFIEFEKAPEASKAIETLNGYPIGHKRLKVAYSRPPSEDMHNANLYFRGLPKEWTDEDLADYCSKFGEIVQSRVLFERATNQSRQTGFVLFNKHTEAATCMDSLNGTTLPGCSEPLIVKIAAGNDQKRLSGVSNGTNGHLQQQIPSFQHGRAPTNRHYMPTDGGPVRSGTGSRMRYNPMVGSPSSSGKTAHQNNNFQARSPHQPSFQPQQMILPHHQQVVPVPAMVSYPRMYGDTATYTGPRMQQAPFLRPPNSAPPIPPPYGMPPTTVPYATYGAGFPAVANGPTPFAVQQKRSSSGGNFSPPAQNSPTGQEHQLFVYNCGTTCGEKELYELFAPFGAIMRVDVVRDQNNGNTKYAFVTMPNYEEACSAIETLNGYTLTRRPLQVKFKAPKT